MMNVRERKHLWVGVALLALVFCWGSANSNSLEGSSVDSLYDLKVKALEAGQADLSRYRGQVTLVVNVASQCGFTSQYEGLQQLQERYGPQGFSVLAFPCNDFGGQEPGTASEISSFCKSRFGVTFPVFAKVQIATTPRSEVYRFLTTEHEPPSWNFCKYLVNREGRVLDVFSSPVGPTSRELRRAIEAALKA